ncbi:MAG: hypothetical protein U0Z53_19000 [Blastocatellia bacterium]
MIIALKNGDYDMKKEIYKFVVLIITSTSLLYSGCVSQFRKSTQPFITGKSVNDKALPRFNLVNLSGEVLSEQQFRKGRYVLIFMTPECGPCQAEGEFIKAMMDVRKDISFLGIISFGTKSTSLSRAAEQFAFQSYFDEGFRLGGAVGLHKVPIKVYVEDGFIKRA